jgi:hypothetical protein
MTKYRVWAVRNPPGEAERWPVSSPWHGAVLIDALAYSDLLDDRIVANAFGLEYLENDGEWYEWYNADGEDYREAYERVNVTLDLKADEPPLALSDMAYSQQS